MIGDWDDDDLQYSHTYWQIQIRIIDKSRLEQAILFSWLTTTSNKLSASRSLA